MVFVGNHGFPPGAMVEEFVVRSHVCPQRGPCSLLERGMVAAPRLPRACLLQERRGETGVLPCLCSGWIPEFPRGLAGLTVTCLF